MAAIANLPASPPVPASGPPKAGASPAPAEDCGGSGTSGFSTALRGALGKQADGVADGKGERSQAAAKDGSDPAGDGNGLPPAGLPLPLLAILPAAPGASASSPASVQACVAGTQSEVDLPAAVAEPKAEPARAPAAGVVEPDVADAVSGRDPAMPGGQIDTVARKLGLVQEHGSLDCGPRPTRPRPADPGGIVHVRLDAPSPPAPPAGQAASDQAPQIQHPVQSPHWGEALGTRVTWMAQNGTHQAQLRLDPPDLGHLEVHISMTGDQASVQFHVQHGLVRDAVEAAIPRLREMLGSQGISMVHVDVSGQSMGGGGHPGAGSPGPSPMDRQLAAFFDADTMSSPEPLAFRRHGLIDAFA